MFTKVRLPGCIEFFPRARPCKILHLSKEFPLLLRKSVVCCLSGWRGERKSLTEAQRCPVGVMNETHGREEHDENAAISRGGIIMPTGAGIWSNIGVGERAWSVRNVWGIAGVGLDDNDRSSQGEGDGFAASVFQPLQVCLYFHNDKYV